MIGKLFSNIGQSFKKRGDKTLDSEEIRNVFSSWSNGGYAAGWKDNPHEQIRHYHHWVYAAVKAIASRVAGTNLKFTRNDTGETLPNSHPLPRLMKAVNPFDTAVTLWMKTVTFLELTGNAYWYVPKNAFGAVSQIWVLPSQNMHVIPDSKSFIKGYKFRNRTVEEEFSADEIIHLKYPSPDSVYYGKGPLQAAASSVDAHESMKVAERKSFENGVFPGLAVQTSEKLSREVRERLEATLRRGFGGTDRAGRALILEQGLNVRPFTHSPREMDFLESSRMTRDEILSVFGVPAAVAGISEDVNRASAEAMLYTFAENTILPKLRLIEAQLTQDLCSTFDTRIEANFESPVPSLRSEDRADMIARIRNGITSVEEERRRLGLSSENVFPANIEQPKDSPDKSGILKTANAVLRGQLRRAKHLHEGENISLREAVLKVASDKDEENRLVSPLVPEFKRLGAGEPKGMVEKFVAKILANIFILAKKMDDDATENEVLQSYKRLAERAVGCLQF
jgi:HK97 family phage portal protein